MPSTPILAEIYMGGMNFTPRNYFPCTGSLLPISSYQALFALLGTTFGGDGRTTFGLPDMRGRAPMGQGRGPGLSDYRLGQAGGEENTTLNALAIPQHGHGLVAVTEAGDTSSPTGAYLAHSGSLDREYRSTGTQTAMNNGAVGSTGGNQSHNNMQPYLALNFYIAVAGIFPSRN